MGWKVSTGPVTGCAFDANGALYTTSYYQNTIFKFSNGPGYHTATPVATLPSGSLPESIVFDGNGNFYVGLTGGSKDVLKYNSDGVLQTSYDVDTTPVPQGPGWMDLASDQSTLFYTGATRHIMRYAVSIPTPTQLANFAILAGTGSAAGLRIMAQSPWAGHVLVADLRT